ncbi:alanyl-tRNA editing protein AlaX [Sulfodiicoccus acidiphilus]|uniref:Alanyl-tRNA editing protein AlaX n=1 Tax=Sulfodiicoccus acidiphilus TaxID=1670455 RepID=A0A348B3D9_9CREN|nr:alanyl-tRNA editing protein AlaXM [Sulfodiicoccus acidiphilus]BBD72691.1 alanyl-tRNA editing protein AlaX [Sulfodiicoccus acidiphilus]GGT95474.1 alanyl-tRNA editing protein AlaX [Sulfodiicoccus acidiphilus]
MAEELFLKDSYIKEFEAVVTKVEGTEVFLDRTAFYPGGGGLENDVGWLEVEGREIEVTKVTRKGNEIAHIVSRELARGQRVVGRVDWSRRYRMMRLHTLSHIIAALAYRKFNALITGGHITPEYAKDDFNVEDKGTLEDLMREAETIAKEGRKVKVYFLPREEAAKIEGVVKLAERMPPEVDLWRIVEIEGVDVQADGGPHVSNTAEIGNVKVMRVENKGKGRKRVYYTVEP